MKTTKTSIMNFGPQHPAAHGVLRLVLELDGEKVVSVDPHIGFLHRGTEKLAETKPYLQNIGYMDRLDYISMMCNEHAYVLAVEALLGITPPIRAQYIRVMFDELSRILNHLFWLGTHALDIGAMSMFFYCFREREDILDCYEAVSGARMHPTYYRPGGVIRDLPNEMPKYKANHKTGSLLDFIWDFTKRFPKKIDEYETLLTNNPIWKKRTVGIGVISPEQAINNGFSGPMLRGSGVVWDLRKTQPYAVYQNLKFEMALGKNGDSYDRYLVRIKEMRESNELIKQAVIWLKNNLGPVMLNDPRINPPEKSLLKANMEAIVNHYKLYSEGYCLPEGEIYKAVEHPKGEFGIYLVSDGANKPYRLKIRSAGFPHLAAIGEMLKGHLLSDVVTIIGTQDIVLGEIDR